MLLDRGELKDWFGSVEIWVEAIIAALALYLFVVHTATATDRSFLNRELLKDKNCMFGTVLMFLIGMPLLRPYAWIAFLTMCVSIAAAKLLQKRFARDAETEALQHG